MESLMNRRFVIAVLTVACLTTVLFGAAPIRSSAPGPGEYDPWLDWNDDGKINMVDISRAAKAFGTSGQNISKASLAYDSGWLDLRNDTGETYTITHNLNDIELQVDARFDSAGNMVWNRTYGEGLDLDMAMALVQTNDGGYAIAGFTLSFGGYDAWLVKTDAFGNMTWNQTYGGTNDDRAYALVQTNDGGYALAGHTDSFGAGDHDFWLVKTDATGNMTWNQTYGGTDHDQESGLLQTSDEGYIVTGSTFSTGAGSSDAWLVKTDAFGNMTWNQTYGGTNDDRAYALVQTNDGGYALAGLTNSYSAGNFDFWLIKTYANGTMQWNKPYGGMSDDSGFGLVQTTDGGYAMAGYTHSFGFAPPNFWLVKTNATGHMEWNNTYGGIRTDYAKSVVQTDDGGYALAGHTDSFGAGDHDFWLVKTDKTGNEQWSQTYGGTGNDYIYYSSFVRTNDGGYAIAGAVDYFEDARGDFGLIKTDGSGGLVWANLTPNTITLYKRAADTSWYYVRVRIWKPR